MDTSVRGGSAADELIQQIIDSGMMDDRQIVIAWADGDESFAYSFINFRHTKEEADTGARALYVWKKTEDEWRVVTDIYQSGLFV
ncbi:MAG: hypothetical protein AAGI45_18150 [Cyanobacteria bacterium P01_H01_bin.26]